ncbi:hypothetical protein BGZ47_010404 [Haplosporangium gracile]|nr:hypothetical protein BGZ47_010404 [Haplosporangium gracile]
MEKRSEMGKLTVKKTMHDIERFLRRSFLLDAMLKESFIKGLLERQFDIPNHRKVLRKAPRGGGYSLYPKEAVIRSLQLPSLSHLTVLGIVSNNDYSINLSEYGLATNLAILRRHPNLMDPRAILLEYQDCVRSYLEFSSGYFEPAYAIFVEKVGKPIASSTRNNNIYLEMKGRFRDLKEQRTLLCYLWTVISSSSSDLDSSISHEDIFPSTPLSYRGSVEQAVAKIVKAFLPSGPPEQVLSFATKPSADSSNSSPIITTSQCDSTTTPVTPAPRPSQPLDKTPSSTASLLSQPTSTGQNASSKRLTSQATQGALNQRPPPSLLKDLPWCSEVALDLRSAYRCKDFASAVAEWVHGYAMMDSRKIQTEIVKAVSLCNQVQIYLHYAFALFAKALRMKSPLLPCPSKSPSITGKISTVKLWDQQLTWGPNDTIFTERTLAMIIADTGFLTSLARQLYSGERYQMSRPKSDATFLDAATAAMIASMAELPLGNIAGMISKPVHTALKSHYSKAQFDIDGTDTSFSDISYFFLHNGSISPRAPYI